MHEWIVFFILFFWLGWTISPGVNTYMSMIDLIRIPRVACLYGWWKLFGWLVKVNWGEVSNQYRREVMMVFFLIKLKWGCFFFFSFLKYENLNSCIFDMTLLSYVCWIMEDLFHFTLHPNTPSSGEYILGGGVGGFLFIKNCNR